MRPLYFFLFITIAFAACNQAASPATAEDAPADDVQTPVTVTNISQEPMTQILEFNATSSYLQQSYVKANTNGYIQSLTLQPGQHVNEGQTLFIIKTKEAKSIGNAMKLIDSSFKFSGTNIVKASISGFIVQLNHQAGDYVQDGEQVAVITDQQSFAFLLDLPFELRNEVPLHKTVTVWLPDSSKLAGVVTAIMPSVDSAAQTERLVIKVSNAQSLPDNLIAKIRIEKVLKTNPVSLPKAAVLTDETQSNFWVMKMIDSITAVKVPVQKGIENSGRVEIVSPVLSASDSILVSGNYGLSDTAKVIVQ